MISIVIPIYNERKNLSQLINELLMAMSVVREKYELIFIDDNSSDGSYDYLLDIKKSLSIIQVYKKQGVRGKAASLMEGFSYSNGNKLVMIDADLQYPPENIPNLLKKLSKYDVVVGNRIPIEKSLSLRRFFSVIYKHFFGGFILGLPFDVQSGLKVFKRSVLHNLYLSPSPWGFDFEFLFKAKRMGWKIGQDNILFLPRIQGKSNVNLLSDGYKLAMGAVKLRIRYFFRSILKFMDYPHHSERLGNRFENQTDFLFVPEIQSAKKHLYAENITFVTLVGLIFAGLIWGISALFSIPVLIIFSGIGSLFYLTLMVFKLIVVRQSFKKKFIDFSKEEIDSISDDELPTYTILIPLYKEAEVIRQIVKAMSAIDYPPDKLDVIITLEEYDQETINAINQVYAPEHFKTLILPNVNPKTKPKALNVALLKAKGEFLVIYDAEIIPDRDQLKKAYLAFNKFPDIACLQTRLDHYNPSQSLLTKLFNAEYSFQYDLFLPGLQKMGLPIPLSGHSTHFRTEVLKKIGGWDPYNVTEDCDTGIRLARMKYKVDILDSLSREEATATVGAWSRQRSRWLKGFVQTTIVHLRHPFRFKQEVGSWKNVFAFLITVPVSVFANLVNVLYWVLLIGWFSTRSEVISSLFPGAIFYLSLFSFIVGNFIFIYLNLVGSYMRGRYEYVKYGLLSPLYWLLLAYAAVKATLQLVINPHHWEKTTHGKHLIGSEEIIPLGQKYDVKV